MFAFKKKNENEKKDINPIFKELSEFCKQTEFVERLCKTSDKTDVTTHQITAIRNDGLKLVDKILYCDLPNCKVAAAYLSDLNSVLNNILSSRITENTLRAAVKARYILVYMCKINSFEYLSTDYVIYLVALKNSLNQSLAILGNNTTDGDLSSVFGRNSDVLYKLIEECEDFDETDIPTENEQYKENLDDKNHIIADVQINKEIIPDENSTHSNDIKLYEDINCLNEEIKQLKKENNDKEKHLEVLTSNYNNAIDELESMKKKYLKAMEEKNALSSNIDNVKREIYATEQFHFDIPLVHCFRPVLQEHKNDNAENDGIKKRSITNIFGLTSQNKSFSNNEKVNINVYHTSLVNTADGVVLEGYCHFLPQYGLYSDKKGRYYWCNKTNLSHKKVSGDVLELLLTETDKRLLLGKYSDEEFVEFCKSNPLCAECLPDYYKFMMLQLTQHLGDGTVNPNDLVSFRLYYMHIITVMAEYLENQYDAVCRIQVPASMLMWLYKCCGFDIVNEPEWIANLINDAVQDNNNELGELLFAKVKEVFTVSSDATLYLDKLKRVFNEYHFNIEKAELIDGKADKNIEINPTNEAEELLDKEGCRTDTYEPTIINSVEIDDNHNMSRYSRIFIPDFNSVRYIIAKGVGQARDISSYAIENVDWAVGQYMYMAEEHKEIGISFDDKKIFILASDQNGKSYSILTSRNKKLMNFDSKSSSLIDFYEYTLLKAIKLLEQDE